VGALLASHALTLFTTPVVYIYIYLDQLSDWISSWLTSLRPDFVPTGSASKRCPARNRCATASLLLPKWRGTHHALLSFLTLDVYDQIAATMGPELLPMITTVTLSRGAVRMARKKVIVKRLSAIHDLGG
jgi:hypothetical protein